jgi:hypothetical protein
MAVKTAAKKAAPVAPAVPSGSAPFQFSTPSIPGAPAMNIPGLNQQQQALQGYQNLANQANVKNLGSAMGSLTGGYNAALGSENAATAMNAGTTSGQLMGLQQQLQQQTGQINQNLINRGLGNTTVAATAPQAAQQTYNQGVANVQNEQALRQMQIQQQLAGLQAGGGQAQANLLGQANYKAPDLNTFANLQQAASNAPRQQQAGVMIGGAGGGFHSAGKWDFGSQLPAWMG